MHTNSAMETRVAKLRAARNRGAKTLAIAFGFSIFVNLLVLTGPLYMLQVYDRVLGARSVETLTALFILVAGLFMIMGVLDFARGRIVARAGARFQSEIEDTLIEASLEQVPQDRAARTDPLRDLDTVQALFLSPVLLALMDLAWTPLFLGTLFVFHPMLGWVAFGGGVVLVGVALLNQVLSQPPVGRAERARNEAASWAEQARHGIEALRAMGMQQAVRERWSEQRTQALGAQMAGHDWTGGFTALSKAFRLFLQSAILTAGAYLVIQNELTAGLMVASAILMGRALAPLEQVIGQWVLVERARSSWRALEDILSCSPQAASPQGLPRPPAELTVRGLTVRPPTGGEPVLKDVGLQLRPGQAIGVIGRSGSGKTSLARALLGLWPPVCGEVRLGNATLDQYNPEDLGRFWGYLPQQVSLFRGSIAENIARMLPRPDLRAVVEAARKAQAHEMILQLPLGYQTQLSGEAGQLSGGQQQRIGLARALYGDPVILVLDEPNSALDAEGGEALNRAIHNAKKEGRAVLIMTHRPMAVSECDDLIVMDAGRIAKAGPREEVLRSMVRNADQVFGHIRQGRAG